MDEDLINQFVSVTSAPRHLAEQYLARNNSDLIDSIEDYYANNQASESSHTSSSNSSKRKAPRYV